MIHDFDAFISKTRTFDKEIYDGDINWTVLRKLYETNYLLPVDVSQKIPTKIHQIWLGGQLPDKFKRFTESWMRFHPDWDYRLWTDADVDGLNMTRIKEFLSSPNMGTRSDIMSYEILRQFGGLYVDTDFECLKPFDNLLYLDYFTGIAYDPNLVLYHGLMASVPNHPIVVSCIEDQQNAYNGENGTKIMDATGPYHITRCFLSKVNLDTKGVVAFPMDFFYPLPNYERWTKTPYSYIQPCSYAIHHWAVSWLNNNK
jgi:mannosyltransferase OCH1-like enzyme